MNKICKNGRAVQSRHVKKLFLIMRLTTILLLTTLFAATANSYSQTAKFSMQLNDVTLKQVFHQIEKSSDFIIVYSDDIVNPNRRVNVEVSNESVQHVLEQALNQTNLTFAISDRQIAITNKTEVLDKILDQQTKTISGVVNDTDGGPIPGVSVVVEGTTIGTVTDFDGNFELNVPVDAAKLLFSFVGFQTQVVEIGTQSLFNVTLLEDVMQLDEVVAIGYGTQQKREVTGSISNVSEKDFNKGLTQDAVDLLKGKVAGLSITLGSGDVTSEQTIRLRGTSSLTGSSQPFIVIDGVPGLSMSSVAPQDIESISVLKDASAAAIYGSRSASGVILITTKKGKTNESIIEYDGYVAASTVTNVPDVLTAQEWRDYTSANGINTEGLDLGANTDWFDEIMRTGVSQNHNFSFSGGGKTSNYRASISYLDQKGVVNDNEMERFNARFYFNQKALGDKLNVSFTGAITTRDYSPTDTRNFVLAYNMIPVAPVKFDDGTWFDTQEYDQGNPVRNIEYNTQLNKRNLYFGNVDVQLDLVEGLKAGVKLHKQRETNDYGQYYNSETERGRNDQGYAQRSNWTADKNLLETTLNYEKSVNDHKIGLLAGYSYEKNEYQNSGAQNRQFVTDFFEYNNLGAGENLRPSDVWSGANMNKLVSFFGRANYNYKMRYIFTASLRYDGSSKFGANHKWATFPSVSAAWRINEESFMQNADFLDELKLRVGYGISGNQDGIDPYKSLELYGSSGQYYDNGKWYRAYQISQNANEDLKWEETSMFNIGVDYNILNSRLSGTIEYYNKKTKDLLYTYQVPVPPYLYPDMLANVGSMSNKGFEFLISGDIIRKNDFRWTTSINLAHNKNKITKLSNDEFSTSSILTGSAWIRGGSDNTTHIVEEGKEVGTFYGWLCEGLDEDGMYIMDDMIDGEPGLTNDDRTYIGSAQPKLTYGISNIINYKKWELNFFFRGVYGNDLLNFSKMSYATTQWLPGANVLHDALTIGLADNPKYCSYYIEKGSFLKLDNLSLSYSFDVSKIEYLRKLRVYVTGQNLFTITNYTGLDPEVEMAGLDPGVEGREYYPKSRTVSLGVNISF
ncbi:iron complex outermembrane recepter protein [Draconibacterium orientale]|uniref:Iron complex outermembrane recepter protein n=2 Tax=Draconibacterium orientale TaxID=1168034 RepID=X5DDM1_9BACT|nr:TonB-dependent receptor [Draconibacterium orientale]SET58467.1 iron complex outermembrane recepter protein [Draconibacterium orientale]